MQTKFDNVSIALGEKQLYRNFSLSFECEKITAMLGPSGCGKTTLLNMLTRLLRQDEGTVVSPQHAAYLFQEPRLLPWYSLEKNISLPLKQFMDSKVAIQQAQVFLARVGLLDRKDELPSRLSGGERQRTALARAFAFPAPLLLMDEAFQSQDLRLKIQLMDLLLDLLKTEKRTVIMVTHDIREALYLADRLIVLAGQPVQIALDTLHDREKSYTNMSTAAHAMEQRILGVLADG